MNKEVSNKIITQMPKLMFGFIVIAIGTNLTRYSNMGLNPWGTFHEGVFLVTGVKFGVVSQVTGLVIIALSLLIKIYPGVGTILNMFFIGFFVDLFDAMNFIPLTDSLPIRIIYLLVGTFFFNYGIYLYLSCELGAGPRDGLLVGLVKLTGISVSIMRPMIEVTIVFIGIMLGSAYGIGTLLNAFGGGYILNAIFKYHGFNPKATKQMVITDLIASKNKA